MNYKPQSEVDILIQHASELITCKSAHFTTPKRGEDLRDLGIIKDGAVAIKDGKIVFVGKSTNVHCKAKEIIDVTGKVVMPGFVDCHTHAIFAGSREDEFIKKQQGLSYLDILKTGGGILSTVKKTRQASKEELYERAHERFKDMLLHGTTTLEVKSGYGLTLKNEMKILEVADMLAATLPIGIVKTYLGAHALPKNVRREKYINDIVSSLEKIKPHAEFCDVFCEKGVFTLIETQEILTAAKKCGFKLKLHAEQNCTLNSTQLACKLSAVSVDHLEHISNDGIKALAKTNVIGVVLPGVSFYLMENIYAPARKMIDRGVALAIATNFNPGSCPSYNMQMMIALACFNMKLLPAEAINCATINAACAINRAHEIGSLEVGKKADILILKVGSHNQLPYYFGINLVEQIIKDGKIVHKAGKSKKEPGNFLSIS